MKLFIFEAFYDLLVEDRVLEGARIEFHYECFAKSLKDALYKLMDAREICYRYPIDMTITGIRSVACEGKLIDWNYKNRVIYKDDKLRDCFWC